MSVSLEVWALYKAECVWAGVLAAAQLVANTVASEAEMELLAASERQVLAADMAFRAALGQQALVSWEVLAVYKAESAWAGVLAAVLLVANAADGEADMESPAALEKQVPADVAFSVALEQWVPAAWEV